MTATVLDLLQETIAKHPEKIALRHKVGGVWQEVSYRETGELSDAVACGLSRRGFCAGDHAALLAPSSPRWLFAYLGILKAGGVVIPIDKELKKVELAHILSDSDANLLFTERPYLAVVREIAAELPELRRIVLLDEKGEGVSVADDGRSAPPSATASAPPPLYFEEFLTDGECPLSPRGASQTAVIIYTSGTTGRAKGAMLTHGNIASNVMGASAHLRLDQSIHTLSLLPISHVFEQVCGVLLPLTLGGTVSFCESVKKFADNLAEVHPTFFLGVPALYRKMLDRTMKTITGSLLSRLLFALPFTRPVVQGKVRQKFGEGLTFISGGAALDPAISEGFEKLGLTIYQGYGITETSPVISAECAAGKKRGTVGRALAGVEVRIASPDEEMVGEIQVKGPNVMQGYYKNPGATAEVLDDGWYKTGDLGRLDADGFLTICGRVKNLIVTHNGKNVYPEEVEIEILKSPFVAEVVVYSHHTEANGEEIRGIVYPDQEALEEYCQKVGKESLTSEELHALIQREVASACQGLAGYKRVKKVLVRQEEFPKTTTRKIKRFEIGAHLWR